MRDHVRFHFDPLCPWCWITSVWVRQLVRLGVVEADWAVFSLEIVNRDREEQAAKRHGRSAHALRTVMHVRDAGGSDAVGRFYEALGTRVHERGEPLDEEATVAAALADTGLDPALSATARADGEAWRRVQAEHDALVERTRSFGVPTIALDAGDGDGDGDGVAIFGPVISRVPSDEDAVTLWRHVAWLARYDNFSELKRDRTSPPDLPRYRD